MAMTAGESTRDRFRGALLGLAVGDALGTTLEFHLRDLFPPLTDMIGGGPFELEAGRWTDDTSMALCLAESLVECEGFDAADQMRRYVRWYRDGHNSSLPFCFDIGNTTRGALMRFEQTGEPYSGDTHSGTAGNRSLMRLAPVAMRFAGAPADTVSRAADSSRTTHAAPEAMDACRWFASLLVGALAGKRKESLLAADYSPAGVDWSHQPLEPAIAGIRAGSFKAKDRAAIKSSGCAVHTLEAALWAFHQTSDFRSGALLAVNLGDDADTVGAVYGQIAGAHYGAPAIPAEWVERIWRRNDIVALADRLRDTSARQPEFRTRHRLFTPTARRDALSARRGLGLRSSAPRCASRSPHHPT
jgi:ADP-ribosylglycohydrolase